MPRITGLPAALKRWGLPVEVVPGWETRGDTSFNPRGCLCHWTAGPPASAGRPSLKVVTQGRPDLQGPLCHVYLDRRGVAVVVAAGRAQHAGAGQWLGLTGNSAFWGTECEAAGPGDFTDAQRAAYPLVCAAYASLSGFDARYVAGHSEYALPRGRKTDIDDYPMKKLRAQVARLLLTGTAEDDMDDATLKRLLWEVLGQDDVLDRIADRVLSRPIKDRVTGTGYGLADRAAGIDRALNLPVRSRVSGSTYADTPAGFAANADAYGYQSLQVLSGLKGALDKLATSVATHSPVTAEELKQAVADGIRDNVIKVDVAIKGA